MMTRMRLVELFDYDKSTGLFTRKVSVRKDRIGTIAGAANGFGHIQIRVDGTLFMAHRLAWMWMYGEWPSTNIDHVNGIPNDNRISNLRLATPKENQENVKLRIDSSTGCRGVNWNKAERKWVSRVQHYKERIVVGKFDSLFEAVCAVKSARNSLYTHNKTEYAS
jgi:hypothetical protein